MRFCLLFSMDHPRQKMLYFVHHDLSLCWQCGQAYVRNSPLYLELGTVAFDSRREKPVFVASSAELLFVLRQGPDASRVVRQFEVRCDGGKDRAVYEFQCRN